MQYAEAYQGSEKCTHLTHAVFETFFQQFRRTKSPIGRQVDYLNQIRGCKCLSRLRWIFLFKCVKMRTFYDYFISNFTDLYFV